MRQSREPSVQRRKLLDEIRHLADSAVFGTLSESYRTCGRAGCHCQHGGPKHGPHLNISYRGEKGKTTGYYVPQGAEEATREGVAAYLCGWRNHDQCGHARDGDVVYQPGLQERLVVFARLPVHNVGMIISPKRVTEYPLPAAAQTHEIIAVPNSNTLLVSQQTNSMLVKVALDPATGAPVRAVAHLVGTPTDGLHGLCNSQFHPGMVWASLQFTSQVVLLDPKSGNVDEPPVILQTFTLPVAARGPHVVIEDGPILWASCKDGVQVVCIAHKESQPYTLYTAERRPIFVAVHKNSGLVFGSEDQSSSILWINPSNGQTGQIPIASDTGSTPVGLIAGPDGNVWFVLL